MDADALLALLRALAEERVDSEELVMPARARAPALKAKHLGCGRGSGPRV